MTAHVSIDRYVGPQRPAPPTSDMRRAGGAGVMAKWMSLLEAFPEDGRAISIADAARVAGLPKSTCHRLMNGLGSHGMVRKTDGGWALSWKIFDLAERASGGPTRLVRDVAHPWLVEAYGIARPHALHLILRDGPDGVLVDKVGGPRACEVQTRVGARRPLVDTVEGAAILTANHLNVRRPGHPVAPGAGHLSEARVGVASDSGRPGGSLSVAAPIFWRGEPVGAVMIGAVDAPFDRPHLCRVANWTAGAIDRDLVQRLSKESL